MTLPIRFADDGPEIHEPEYLCVDCGDVEVSDEGERCVECWMSLDARRREDNADRVMCLRGNR